MGGFKSSAVTVSYKNMMVSPTISGDLTLVSRDGHLKVYNGYTERTVAYVDEITSSTSGASGSINVKDPAYGAVGNGVTDDSDAIESAINASVGLAVFLPAGTYYFNKNKTISGKTFILHGEGTIHFGQAGTLSLANCNDSKIIGIKFIGGMTTDVQYAMAVNGVASAFTSPTFTDGSGSVTGSDFTHTLSGNLLTVSLLALPNFIQRCVVGSFIALNPAKRYIAVILPGFVSGDGANDTRFQRYNNVGTLLGEHFPGDSSTWYSSIDGTSNLSITVGASRHWHTANNLTCVYDLSKIQIYEVIGDGASVNYGGASIVGESSNLYIAYSSQVEVSGCVFTRMLGSACKFVHSDKCQVHNNRVLASYQGFTFDLGSENLCSENMIDLRLKDSLGNLLDNRFLRMRGIAGVSEDELTARGNYIRGAAWAIEILTYSANKTTRVINNDIVAPFAGISIDGGTGDIVCYNTVRLSPSGVVGIEVPASGSANDGAIIAHNVITTDDFAYQTIGISLNGSTKVTVSHNQIHATIGVFSPNAGTEAGPYVVSKNEIRFGLIGVWFQHDRVNIEGNSLRLVNNWMGFAGQVPGTIIIQSGIGWQFTILDNHIESTATYGVCLNSTKFGILKGNVIYDSATTTDGRPFSCVLYPNTVEVTPGIAWYFNSWLTWGSSRMDAFAVLPGAVAGSKLDMWGNLVQADFGDDCRLFEPGPWTYVRGQNMQGYVHWIPGTVAAGATVTSPDIVIDKAAFGDYVGWSCRTYALIGFTVTAYVHAAGICKIVLTNFTGSPITLEAADWEIRLTKVPG